MAARAWSGPKCLDCGGHDFSLLIGDGGEADTHLSLHLGPGDVEETMLMPLVGGLGTLAVEIELDAHPALRRCAVSRVTRWAATALATTPEGERALWLLRQLDLQDDWNEADDEPKNLFASVPGQVAALAAGLASEDDFELAVDTLADAVQAGHFGSDDPEPGGIPAATWAQLLEEVVAGLERLEIQWEAIDLPYAAHTAATSLWKASDLAGVALLPQERWDRLVWRELLACVVMEEDLEEHLDVHAPFLARIARTPADVAREIGAPAGFAQELARALGVEADAPIGARTSP